MTKLKNDNICLDLQLVRVLPTKGKQSPIVAQVSVANVANSDEPVTRSPIGRCAGTKAPPAPSDISNFTETLTSLFWLDNLQKRD